MKITKTFENATLRTVNNGYIELDYNGKTHCFNNASVVSINNGTIIIESEWTPKRGELIKLTGCNTDCYCIYRQGEPNYIYDYGYKKISDSTLHTEIDDSSWCTVNVIVSPVTPEEQKEFNDFCKSQGKIWNKEKLQWEKYKWQPKQCEKYYYIDTLGEVSCTTNNTLQLDPARIKYGNCFPTKEQAQKAAKKLKEFFKLL